MLTGSGSNQSFFKKRILNKMNSLSHSYKFTTKRTAKENTKDAILILYELLYFSK